MTCHPQSAANTVEGVDVSVERGTSGRFWLRYYVDGPLNDLILPGPATPERTDGLWKTTCFEAFVKTGNGADYLELNFAPSSQWAAYRFEGYRQGMTNLPMANPPEIGNDAGEDNFALEAEFTLPGYWADKPLSLNLTAVIETVAGKSYWALKHPPGAPDFHHKDCFALHLGAPGDL
jgi:hypothetical protein